MFRVYFNRKTQWFEVFLEDVSPETFHRQGGGRWGYFLPTWERPRVGKFGEIHLVSSRVRPDVVAHELLHLWIAWLQAKGVIITSRNEEILVLLYDELIRHFWKEFERNPK